MLVSYCALLFMITVPASADVQGLAIIGQQDGEIAIAVPEPGVVALNFHHTDAAKTGFDVDVSSFLSADDQLASVTIGNVGDAATGTQSRIEFPQDLHRAALELRANDLVPGVKYTGTLTASSPASLKP